MSSLDESISLDSFGSIARNINTKSMNHQSTVRIEHRNRYCQWFEKKKLLLELKSIPLAEGSTTTKFDINCVCRGGARVGARGHLPLIPPKKVLHIFL